MDIYDERGAAHNVRFDYLKAGEVFQVGYHYFIKISTEANAKNVFDLTDQKMHFMEDFAIVEHVNAELHIKPALENNDQ